MGCEMDRDAKPFTTETIAHVCIPAWELLSTNTRRQDTCPIPKRISEATNKHIPESYLKSKGDIGRVWRAAFPIISRMEDK